MAVVANGMEGQEQLISGSNPINDTSASAPADQSEQSATNLDKMGWTAAQFCALFLAIMVFKISHLFWLA